MTTDDVDASRLAGWLDDGDLTLHYCVFLTYALVEYCGQRSHDKDGSNFHVERR